MKQKEINLEKRVKTKCLDGKSLFLGGLVSSALYFSIIFNDTLNHLFIGDFPDKIASRIEIGPYNDEYEDALTVWYFWEDEKTSGAGITFFRDGERYYHTDKAIRKYAEKHYYNK